MTMSSNINQKKFSIFLLLLKMFKSQRKNLKQYNLYKRDRKMLSARVLLISYKNYLKEINIGNLY